MLTVGDESVGRAQARLASCSIQLESNKSVPFLDRFVCCILMAFCVFILFFRKITDARLVALNIVFELRYFPFAIELVWLVWLSA